MCTPIARSFGWGRQADFSPDAVCVGKEVSLTDALVALSMLWKVTIVLIIDEARLVMTSETASATMHALKAARDELNSSKHSGLRIVFMDVDKESLRQLCGSWDQPFTVLLWLNCRSFVNLNCDCGAMSFQRAWS
ncbi:hypothetical protein D3C80_1717810 [compost metagenome]